MQRRCRRRIREHAMNDINIEAIKKAIAETGRPPRPRELARIMKVGDTNYRRFRKSIKDAIASGQIEYKRGGRLGLPGSLGKIRARLIVARSGIGFAIPEDGSGEIFISEDDLGGAMHGEKVIVELKRFRRGKSREGKVVRVLERQGKQIVGRLIKTRHGWLLNPDDPRLSVNIAVDNPEGLALKPDHMAVVVLYDWKADYLPPTGKISEILGPAGSPGVDIDALVRSSGVPIEFSPESQRESKGIPVKITAADLKGRLDLRKIPVFTIDPADAKDHDDAVSLERTENGMWKLGVHIADVSHYVKAGSDLDREALLRGNSIYLVDRVIPMLPEKLSGDVCSLHEGVDRLTLSVFADIDRAGNIKKHSIVPSVIRSRASLNYDDVQACLDGNPNAKTAPFKDLLLDMNELAKILRNKRLKEGSLDFDLPEPKVVLDTKGNIVDIFRYPRYDSHRLIEEFMLVANCIVAKQMQSLAAPILYRVHDRPDKTKIDNFAELLAEMGYKFNFKGDITPKKLQRVLEKIKGQKDEEFIHQLMLRSLAKAVYQPENIGHFGLAFDTYAHFTSPIRRYPDLHLHRIVKIAIAGKLDSEAAAGFRKGLTEIGKHCSETEVIADELERESIKIKLLEYFRDKIGYEMNGTISGVVRNGLFVEIDDLFIEGFVPYSAFGDDYYIFDEKRHQAAGRRNKKVFRLGDKIKVIVARIDSEKRSLELLPSTDKKRRSK